MTPSHTINILKPMDCLDKMKSVKVILDRPLRRQNFVNMLEQA